MRISEVRIIVKAGVQALKEMKAILDNEKNSEPGESVIITKEELEDWHNAIRAVCMMIDNMEIETVRMTR